MKKLFIVQEEELTFTAEVDKRKISMNYSNSASWMEHTKGQRVGKLIDTGNGIKIQMEEGVTVTLDYYKFVNLFILMSLKMKTDENLAYTPEILTNI